MICSLLMYKYKITRIIFLCFIKNSLEVILKKILKVILHPSQHYAQAHHCRQKPKIHRSKDKAHLILEHKQIGKAPSNQLVKQRRIMINTDYCFKSLLVHLTQSMLVYRSENHITGQWLVRSLWFTGRIFLWTHYQCHLNF